MNAQSGYFMEPQNFSVNDGEGIRTILFFAGCPLNCMWCSNPESYGDVNRVAYDRKTCISCGRCTQICPNDVGIDLSSEQERTLCSDCGQCVEVCPTESRKRLIQNYSKDKILKIIEKQELFYRFSGGGVTFSGGEATLQYDMFESLVTELYDRGTDLAIETCGHFDFDQVKESLQKMNLIFVDIKHMDHQKHEYFTGMGNQKILENIARLDELSVDVIIRIPVIMGMNADEDNIRRTAQYVKTHLKNPKIELLPYHSYGEKKYDALGLKRPSVEFGIPSKEHMDALEKIIEEEGVQVVSFR